MMVLVLGDVQPLVLDVGQFLLGPEVALRRRQVLAKHLLLKLPPFLTGVAFLRSFWKKAKKNDKYTN